MRRMSRPSRCGCQSLPIGELFMLRLRVARLSAARTSKARVAHGVPGDIERSVGTAEDIADRVDSSRSVDAAGAW